MLPFSCDWGLWDYLWAIVKPKSFFLSWLRGRFDADANPEAASGNCFQKQITFSKKYILQFLFLFLQVLFMVDKGYSQTWWWNESIWTQLICYKILAHFCYTGMYLKHTFKQSFQQVSWVQILCFHHHVCEQPLLTMKSTHKNKNRNWKTFFGRRKYFVEFASGNIFRMQLPGLRPCLNSP